MRSKAFEIGFLGGLLPFVVANVYSYRRLTQMIYRRGCDDCGGAFGLPLEMFAYNGFIGRWSILWGGLTVNIILAMGVGLVVGWVCERVFKPGRLR
jgi:hypothetical protein